METRNEEIYSPFASCAWRRRSHRGATAIAIVRSLTYLSRTNAILIRYRDGFGERQRYNWQY
jgi:hypothetical protein